MDRSTQNGDLNFLERGVDLHEQAIRRFRSHVRLLLFARAFLTLATGWIFLWATGVLVLRVSLRMSLENLLWGAAGVPLTALLALVLAFHRTPPRLAVRAVIDRQGKYGGLLMAAEEEKIGGWQSSLPAPQNPRLRWHGGKPFGLFLASLAFLLVTLLFPQRFVALASTPLEIYDDIAKLNRQIETLKEEKILDPARAETFEKKLAQIEEEAEGHDPSKTWEALDHVLNMAAKAAQEAAEEALSKTEELTKAEKLAEAIRQAAEKMDPQAMNEAMAELAEMVEQAKKESQELMEQNLSAALMNACKEGTLSPDQLKQLADALRGGKKDLKQKLEKLREAGLIDLKTMQMCEKIGQCDCSGLAAFLAENEGEMSLEEMLERDGDGGRGGVNRGRGDAAMTWTDGSSEEGIKFKEKTLPPSSLQALKDSAMLGVSKAKPQTDPQANPAKSGALSNANTGGGAANTQIILPRHRGTVERYFERR